MKRIVDGVAYNTDTAAVLAHKSWHKEADDSGNPEVESKETLYHTFGGAFFRVEEKTKMKWNQREQEHEKETSIEFIPMSADQAQKWIRKGEVEVVSNPFGDRPEADLFEGESGATIYVRVPSSLKRLVDEAAKKSNTSQNIWAMRCVERCLDPHYHLGDTIPALYHILTSLRFALEEGQEGAWTDQQKRAAVKEAIELTRKLWIDSGCDDKSIHSDIDTRIMEGLDAFTRQVLENKYRWYNDNC